MIMGLLALLIPGLTGYYILRCFKGRRYSFELMDIFLMVGLGLGISAQIIFYVLIFSGHIDCAFIIGVYLLSLCVLFLCSYRYLSKQLLSFSFSFRSVLIVGVILALVALAASILAVLRPWGDWDGWSYWNYRASFFFKSGHDWPRMFQLNMQQQHPWMLPLIILWGWAFYASQRTIVPMAIGIIFTVSTVGLLIGALKKHVSFFWAVLGGVFLASIPMYLLQGTSQYADIVAAYFILLSSVLALDFLKSPSVSSAALTGLCLGLTATVKDNSIVAALLLFFLIIMRLRKRGLGIFIKPLCWGFITIAVSVVLMRCFEVFYSYHNTYGVFLPGLLDWHKWYLTGQFVWKTLINILWGGLWPLVFFCLIAKRVRRIKGEIDVLIQFIALYTIFYLFIFVASALRLEWLLTASFDRTVFLLAPVVVFVMFYIIGKKE